jgi:chromosome segregation ATPase
LHDLPPHQLRRAWFSGYRVADVEVLLAHYSLRLSHLSNELEAAQYRLGETERERRDVEQRLIEAHRREADLAGSLAARAALIERAETEAERRAKEIVDEAQLAAARIQARALSETEHARSQTDALLRLRDTLSSIVRAAARDLEAVSAPEVTPPSSNHVGEPESLLATMAEHMPYIPSPDHTDDADRAPSIGFKAAAAQADKEST